MRLPRWRTPHALCFAFPAGAVRRPASDLPVLAAPPVGAWGCLVGPVFDVVFDVFDVSDVFDVFGGSYVCLMCV